MVKNILKILIRQVASGYYFNKKYSTKSYLAVMVVCIALGLITLGSEFGYFVDDTSMQGFGQVSSSPVLLSIPMQEVYNCLAYLFPGITFSFFLVLIMPKNRILNSYILTFILFVFMYSVAFALGHIFAIPNLFTGGILAGCIGLMMDDTHKRKLKFSLGAVGTFTGFLGAVAALYFLPVMNTGRIPYFYCYLLWQVGIGLFLIYNYEEKEEETHEIIQIP